jgi:hypothetical protein
MHYNYSTMQNDNWFDFIGLMLKRSERIYSPAISSALDGAVDILGFSGWPGHYSIFIGV